LLSPDSIQEGEEKNISVVAQGIPLRIVGYVERIVVIVPGLTNRQFQMHFRVSRSSFQNFVPIIQNIIKNCIKTPLNIFFSRSRRFTAVRYLTDVKSDVWVISPAPLDIGNMGTLLVSL
jgi:hypothetical protein